MLRMYPCGLHQVVSKSNWAQVWPSLETAIKQADFVAFDYELTGLHEKPEERFVGVAQSYEAHSQGVKKFIPIQLGICAAKYVDSKWVLTPASIYMQPRDETFGISTSALSFLSSTGFNFNEWASQGMGWLSPIDEEERRSMITGRINEIKQAAASSATKLASPSQPQPLIDIVNPDDQQLLDDVRTRVKNFKLDDQQDCLEIPIESAFQRLLAHTVISNEFPDLFSHSVQKRALCVYKHKDSLFKEQLETLYQQLEKLEEERGLRSIFDLLSVSKTTIVGHNCFYDLLHTYACFYGPLPPYVDTFKQKWTSKFQKNFDTKYLAEANDVLGGLQPPATLKGLCDFMIQNGSGKVNAEVNPIGSEFNYFLPPSVSDKSHDAGYDAMMTSYVFILQLQHIMERKSLTFSDISWKERGNNLIAIQDLLRTACNRVRLVKTQPPSIHLNERQ